MFKKHACYLSICLLVAPLVATAEALPVEPLPVTTPAPIDLAPVQQALAQLPSVCPGLAPQIDAAAQLRLQAFYQQQGDVALWSDEARRQALHAQLQLLAPYRRADIEFGHGAGVVTGKGSTGSASAVATSGATSKHMLK